MCWRRCGALCKSRNSLTFAATIHSGCPVFQEKAPRELLRAGRWLKPSKLFAVHDPNRDSGRGTPMVPVQKIVLLSAAMALLAGCMPDSPRTALEWGVND